MDPPWSFRAWNGKTGTPHRGQKDHYDTMTVDDLSLLPVGEVTAKNCALIMWVVDSHLDQALWLGKELGFTFKTVLFVWVKAKRGGWPRLGMGYYTRKQTELVLLFTKGKPKRLTKGVPQLMHCPRGPHSAKPEIQYGLIESLFAGPYLEMFARTSRPGWQAWGHEIGKRDSSLFSKLD